MDPAASAAALTEAAKAINAPRTVEGTAEAILRAARECLPAFTNVGVSVARRNGRLETLAGSDELVWELDTVQYTLEEGPCVDSVRREPVVLLEHAPQERRWPRYVPHAVERGLRSQLGLRLRTDQETLGGLNLYSTSADAIDAGTVRLAELFATHASIAFSRALHEAQLHEALASRKTIGQAVGIVMERYKIGEERAFEFLVRTSSARNVKLRKIAEEVVAETEQDVPETP